MSEWWDKGTTIPYKSSSFQRILDFYLFHCPCEIEKHPKNAPKEYCKVSMRATTLRAQGWTKGNLNMLLAAMKHTSSGTLEYHLYKSVADIGSEVKRIERNSSLSDDNFEMIVITERSDMSKTSSIFYYIRNALAHGSFSTMDNNGERTYYLESAKGNKINAQIRLREKTLLEWINDFELSPKKLKETLDKEKKQKKRKRKAA